MCCNVNAARLLLRQHQKRLQLLEEPLVSIQWIVHITPSLGAAPMLFVGEELAEFVEKFALDLWLAQRNSERLPHLAMDFRPQALVMDFLLRRLDLACSDLCESHPLECSVR